MSEVQSRPPTRGRGAGRGGRGGFASRGGNRTMNRAASNGEKQEVESVPTPAPDEDAETNRLRMEYGTKVETIREMFTDWSYADIVYALNETDGDMNEAVTRIADGTISQWGEVSKPKKDRAKAKAKTDISTLSTGDSVPAANGRNARGGARGRGRVTERGGRITSRGKSSVASSGRPKHTTRPLAPTEESSDWGITPSADPGAYGTNGWGEAKHGLEHSAAAESAAAVPAPASRISHSPPTPKTSIIPDGVQKTWASMLRQAAIPKPAPKPKEPEPKVLEQQAIEPLPPVDIVSPDEHEPTPEQAVYELGDIAAAPVPPVVVPEIALPPPKDELTKVNLELIPDSGHEPVTETAASEAADSWDPRHQGSANATPLSASQQQHQQAHAAASGYAATAIKATERQPARVSSYSRRVLDQQEAVRMPGNRDQIDRAALQFGAFCLGDDDDIDGDREEPETRPQPPEDSPISHPRTSLPPPQPAPGPDGFAAQKAATSLHVPAAPSHSATAAPPDAPTQPAAASQSAGQSPQPPYGRYGQAGPPDAFGVTKPFDSSYGQQPTASVAPSQYEPTHSQGQQPVGAALSSAPGDYTSYYTADPQSRQAYNSYYQNYAQQYSSQGQQDGLASQAQRSYSGYGPQSDNMGQYPQSGHAASRFGAGASTDVQMSGNNTPTPAGATQVQQAGQAGQALHGQQQSHDHPYNHPYYNPYYNSGYMNNYGGYGPGGYAAPYGKSGLYSNQYAPGYGTSAAGFGQSLTRAESGPSDYNLRVASGQTGQHQALGSGFGAMQDSFGRGGAAYQSQVGQSYNAGSQPGGSSSADEMKHFGDAKLPAGPSPSMAASARPGSAANNTPSQAGLPPPQSNQQSGIGGIGGFGGYPNHLQGHGLNHNQSGTSGYGMGTGANQGHQGHQAHQGHQGHQAHQAHQGQQAHQAHQGHQGHQGHQSAYSGGGYGARNLGGGSYYSNSPQGWGNNYH